MVKGPSKLGAPAPVMPAVQSEQGAVRAPAMQAERDVFTEQGPRATLVQAPRASADASFADAAAALQASPGMRKELLEQLGNRRAQLHARVEDLRAQAGLALDAVQAGGAPEALHAVRRELSGAATELRQVERRERVISSIAARVERFGVAENELRALEEHPTYARLVNVIVRSMRSSNAPSELRHLMRIPASVAAEPELHLQHLAAQTWVRSLESAATDAPARGAEPLQRLALAAARIAV